LQRERPGGKEREYGSGGDGGGRYLPADLIPSDAFPASNDVIPLVLPRT